MPCTSGSGFFCSEAKDSAAPQRAHLAGFFLYTAAEPPVSSLVPPAAPGALSAAAPPDYLSRGPAPPRRAPGIVPHLDRSRTMSTSSFRVSVEKDYLLFAAGHFITYGDLCEALHGHNYRVRVELEGELDENAYVFDFVVLKRIMRKLVNELDHRMLLPLNNPMLEVREEGEEITVHFRSRNKRYVFPREDVMLLDIPNTTAEMLARHLTGRLREELAEAGGATPTAIVMMVEETTGQAAWYRETL
jgi:6-pyruvoyltetrahydropterin/6-carboxytetrahydropterin synthase